MAHILAVDDSKAIQRLIQRLVERSGNECTTTSSAEEALEWLRSNHADLVLSDVNMPGVSGIELVQRISKEFPEVPFVMVTAVDDPEVGRVVHGSSGREAEVYIIAFDTLDRPLIAGWIAGHRECHATGWVCLPVHPNCVLL